ncbi:MAG TPA: Ig-like domain-containing protein, partial [Kofleriaceae bacterium]|nr:Ig-like domain-containing protein [Kofleriaceae bacterium]
MTHLRFRSSLALLGALHLSCGPKPQTDNGGGGGGIAHPGGAGKPAGADIPDGLVLRLGEGREALFATGGPMAAPVKAATTAPISKAEIDQLLSRLQAIKSEAGDQKDFALRERSQPPPRPGETIHTAFPPPPGNARPPVIDPASRELTVLRHAPDGDVPLAPNLSVTFSLPMIAVTSHDDAVKNLPVTLTPQPKGHWRWIGTQTLLFDPDPRFPQATTYKVDIAAGTRAATGETLKQAVSFSFTTPAPRLLQSYPTGGPQRRDPVFFARFDQKVDAAAVLATISVSGGGAHPKLRLASGDEIKGSAEVAALVAAARSGEQDGRWLAFVADAPLPTDTEVAVTVGPGTPSAEGPRTTAAAQSWSFHTYGPFKLVRTECWGSCPPGAPWQVEFTNPIDAEAFDGITVKVSPEIKFKSWVNYTYLTVQGRAKGRTSYQL